MVGVGGAVDEEGGPGVGVAGPRPAAQDVPQAGHALRAQRDQDNELQQANQHRPGGGGGGGASMS